MPRVSMGGALARAFAGYNQGQDQRRELEEREKRSALQQAMAEHEMKQEAARAQMQREQFEYGKGQDAREWERRDQLEARRQQERTGDQLAEQGQMILPGGFGRVKVGPSKLEQAMHEREAANRAKLEAEERGRKHDIDMLGRRQSFDAQQNAANRESRQNAVVKLTQGERQGAAQYELAKASAERIEQRYKEGKVPDKSDRWGETFKAYGPDFIGDWMQSDDAQQMYDDLTNVIMASQYALSGKAVTESEARKIARGLVPQPGDKPGRAAQKRAEVQNRLRVVRITAGRAAQDEARPDFDDLLR